MTFEYFKKTGEIIGKDGEWDGDEGFLFDYDVDDKDLKKAILILLDEEYFDCKTNLDKLKEFVNEFDLFDKLKEYYKDELKDYFEEEAFEQFE